MGDNHRPRWGPPLTHWKKHTKVKHIKQITICHWTHCRCHRPLWRQCHCRQHSRWYCYPRVPRPDPRMILILNWRPCSSAYNGPLPWMATQYRTWIMASLLKTILPSSNTPKNPLAPPLPRYIWVTILPHVNTHKFPKYTALSWTYHLGMASPWTDG